MAGPFDIIQPHITRTHYAFELSSRIPGFAISRNVKVTLLLTVRDTEGNPRDLATYDLAGGGTASLEFFEASGRRTGGQTIVYDPAEAEVGDWANGLVRMTMALTLKPGIYTAHLAIKDSGGAIVVSRRHYCLLAPATGADSQRSAMPTLETFRLSIRDSMGEENYLLDEHQFDVAEVCHAMLRAVQFFNEMEPRSISFNTITFPYPEKWLEGAIATLFMTVAEFYRKNRMAYSGKGGIQIDDLDKEKNYMIEGQRRWEEFKGWINVEKRTIHQNQHWGMVG